VNTKVRFYAKITYDLVNYKKRFYY